MIEGTTWRRVLDAIPGALRGEIVRPLTPEISAELRPRLLQRIGTGLSPEGAQPTDDVLVDAIYREAASRLEAMPSSTAARVVDELLVELS